jgi:hypothetical protein
MGAGRTRCWARRSRGWTATSYSLVGMVGHDFYQGERQGSRGYPRFTDPALRGEDGYAGVRERCLCALAGALRQRIISTS